MTHVFAYKIFATYVMVGMLLGMFGCAAAPYYKPHTGGWRSKVYDVANFLFFQSLAVLLIGAVYWVLSAIWSIQ